MDKVIMCFPGQGSQKPNMAIDLYNYSSKVKELFQLASDVSHIDLYKILLDGDKDVLKQTEVAQNAIVLASLSAYYLLCEKGLYPVVSAGFSLGEIMALRSSEMIDDETLFNIIHQRSNLMAQSSIEATKKYGEMGMAAIINLNSTKIENIIKLSNLKNIFVANNNSENQVVISGVKKEIEEITPLLKENGARRVLMLQVSGPFHTPLLKTAEIQFKEYLDKIKFNEPKSFIYSNVTGLIEKNIKPYISKQITNKVQWLPIMKDIKKNFDDRKIIEVGVSNTLTNFFKTEEMICEPCGTLEQIKGL